MIRLAGIACVYAVVALGVGQHTIASPRMERTPDYVLARCKATPRLRFVCPRVLPWMVPPRPHWDAALCLAGRSDCQGVTWDGLDLGDAGNGTRPPVWSHISLYAGNVKTAFAFRYPTRGPRVTEVNGLFAKPRRRAVFLGAYTWGHKHGTLVLAPAYPSGGQQGDHLIFRWRQSGIDCDVSLHGWEPLSNAVATLRAMVNSIYRSQAS